MPRRSNLKQDVIPERIADAQVLINQIFIPDWAHEHGITIKESGMKICCPFHNERSPSMSVDFENNVFNCFGCGRRGHFLEFYRAYLEIYEDKKLNNYNAIESLLSSDRRLQEALGFDTIYRLETYVDPDFTWEKGYNFTKPMPLRKDINTINMDRVVKKLRSADVERIQEFVADCENGYTYDMLIKKYWYEEDFRVVIPQTLPPPELTQYFKDIINNEMED